MVKMIIGEVQTQTTEIKAFGQAYSQALESVTSATQGIQLAVGLNGAGMESIKDYLSTVYPALCKAEIMHSEAVVQANERYVQGYLSTCGSEDLDSEELQAQIDEANALIQGFQSSRENYAQQKRSLSDEKEQLLGAVFQAAIASMYAGITRNQAKKAKIQEKLEKFLDFCRQSTSYFTGIKDTGSLVAKGMQALGVSEKGHVGPCAWNGKGFSLTDRTWINNVNQNWTKREKAIEVKDRKILDGCTIIHIIDADRGVDMYMFEKNGRRYPVSEQDLSDNLRKLIKKYDLDVVELSPTEMDRRVTEFQKSGKDYFSGATVNMFGFNGLNYIQSTVNDLKESGFWDAAWGVGLTVAAVRNAQAAGKKAGGLKNPNLTQESINSKLDGYLLNKEHPVGGSKANWFDKALGFNRNNSQQLSKQITFDKSTAVQTSVTDYGTKYSQIIPIKGVNGKIIDVEFVWIKNNDGVVRLVTSIPTKK
ncbi:hypothetical protein JZO66_05930 [Enterococcus sp. DIV0242_7C1]|uniref:LXG domain-containing protein n=1 Tax=Candidatus Enterococcus dunnyi TaxID=1834192 RepID=A0A200IZX1_9ENTE|nr:MULTISPECIES: DUF6883 domain-containing protein [unclassified Enterococcus]MBO0470074.1 hypothetical protein [Enterococcus sp. DIV0242_7C1]OUZ30526.1 hypothetical protein A5889_002814 [Enterococcus sp. 9D6_DIV0238]